MAPVMMDMSLLTVLMLTAFLLAGCASGSCANETFKFCGSWRHGNNTLTVHYNVTPGCNDFNVSADGSSLSLAGRITTRCSRSGAITLSSALTAGPVDFCVHWDPWHDHVWLKVPGRNVTICQPLASPICCCTDLSPGVNQPRAEYGVANGSVRGDGRIAETFTGYTFSGEYDNINKEYCEKASQGPNQVHIDEGVVMRPQVVGNVALPETLATVVEMKEEFQGLNFTAPAPDGIDPESTPSIQLPSCLKAASKEKAKVVCTFFRTKTLFQEPTSDVVILDDVVGLTVQNEVITNLAERIKIGFQHGTFNKTYSRKCVSWDPVRDPEKVNWKEDGCVTEEMGATKTECQCNHMTYFTIMVQLERRPVPHLLALTVITAMGNAVSAISCVAVIVFLCNKWRAKEQSSRVHLGLAVSLCLLNVLFFFTGTLANVGGEGLCRWVGSALHYALLSSFTWMAIEVFYTYWLVCNVFSHLPKVYIWYLIGFGLPALPVIILLSIGNIYGVLEVAPSDDPSNPYLMCWMNSTPEAMLAHYLINITVLVALVSSGLVMLFMVYWKIHTRDEWRNNKVAFISIWGLSCLFGTTWGLGFLDFGPFTNFLLFLSCILNSLQGFFLMLRFYMLAWVKRRGARDSTLGGSSLTGSTRQHMLQTKEHM